MVTKEWGEFAYAPPECRRGNLIVLTPDEAHHLLRVRRVRTGVTVRVTDGRGLVHLCRVGPASELEILESFPELNELPVSISLFVSPLKSDLNREIVSTATQLGARRIIFFVAGRSESRMGDSSLGKLEKKAIASIKQCGRAHLPKIESYPSLENALNNWCVGSPAFVAHPTVDRPPLEPFHPEVDKLALLVGPEGGLLDSELSVALERGFIPLSFGRRRLRTETAVAAGLAYLLFRCQE